MIPTPTPPHPGLSRGRRPGEVRTCPLPLPCHLGLPPPRRSLRGEPLALRGAPSSPCRENLAPDEPGRRGARASLRSLPRGRGARHPRPSPLAAEVRALGRTSRPQVKPPSCSHSASQSKQHALYVDEGAAGQTRRAPSEGRRASPARGAQRCRLRLRATGLFWFRDFFLRGRGHGRHLGFCLLPRD